MAYESPDSHRRSKPRRSQGRAGESRGITQGPVTSQGRRPAQARGGSASQYRNARGYRTVGRNDAGYNLRQHNIRFNDRRGGAAGRILGNPRATIALIVAVFLVVVAFFGISSCVRGCSKRDESVTTVSERDARVAAGLSDELTDQLSAQLDAGEQMALIAAHADKISDTRLVELALTEPSAIEFVAGLLADNPDLSTKPYGSDAAKGSYPMVYDWDPRWGYADFNNGMLALTGSGPTSLTIAYVGLTGNNDRTPADFAKIATSNGSLDASYGTSPAFMELQAKANGLDFYEFSPDGESLTDVVESGTVVLAQLKPGTFGAQAHWAVVVSENLDGSVNINDPTSSANTAHPWDPATVASAAQDFYALSVDTTAKDAEKADGKTEEKDADKDAVDSTDDTTDEDTTTDES